MAAAAPLIADPIVRNRGTLVGSLCHADPQGDWASVVTALGGHVVAQGPERAAHDPGRRLRVGAVPDRARLRRDRRRGRDPRPPRARPTAVTSSSNAGSATSPRPASPSPSSAPATVVSRAGIALTGVGGSTINAADAGAVAGRRAAHRGEHRPRPPSWRPPPPGPAATTAGAPSTSVISCIPSSCGSSTVSSSRRRGRPDMSSLFEEIQPGRPADDVPVRRVTITRQRRAPGGRRSSRGCCWPT